MLRKKHSCRSSENTLSSSKHPSVMISEWPKNDDLDHPPPHYRKLLVDSANAAGFALTTHNLYFFNIVFIFDEAQMSFYDFTMGARLAILESNSECQSLSRPSKIRHQLAFSIAELSSRTSFDDCVPGAKNVYPSIKEQSTIYTPSPAGIQEL
jgi:hypothetical protein